MSTVCPERITQARELAGLTKTQLADALLVSAAAVTQWENGGKNRKNPTLENLSQIARELDVPIRLLMTERPDYLNRKGPTTFRALADAKTRRANKKASSLAELAIETLLWLGTLVALPEVQVPTLPTKEYYEASDLEQLAKECRRSWGLGDRPIHKLGELFQSKGVFIARAKFGDDRFDAFSCVIDGSPIMFLGGEKKDIARSRWDCAHEFGHILLHQHWSDSDLLDKRIHKQIEDEANNFAGSFLLPEESFAADVVDASLNGFLRLKPKWGVSAQAMIRRAYDLELINERIYTNLCVNAGRQGMRKAKGEPFDDHVPELTFAMARKSLELLEANKILKRSEIPDILPFPLGVFSSAFAIDASELMPPNPQIINFPSRAA